MSSQNNRFHVYMPLLRFTKKSNNFKIAWKCDFVLVSCHIKPKLTRQLQDTKSPINWSIFLLATKKNDLSTCHFGSFADRLCYGRNNRIRAMSPRGTVGLVIISKFWRVIKEQLLNVSTWESKSTFKRTLEGRTASIPASPLCLSSG